MINKTDPNGNIRSQSPKPNTSSKPSTGTSPSTKPPFTPPPTKKK